MTLTIFKTFEDYWHGQTLIHIWSLGGKIGEIWRNPNQITWKGRFYGRDIRFQAKSEQEVLDLMDSWFDQNKKENKK